MKPVAYRPLTYLAGPYSHEYDEVKNFRYECLTKAAAWLMTSNPSWNVFSPITSSHPLHVIGNMRGDWKFWKRIDTQYLRLSRRMVVLTLPGWDTSVGVTAELKIAKKLKIKVLYCEPFTYILTAEPKKI